MGKTKNTEQAGKTSETTRRHAMRRLTAGTSPSLVAKVYGVHRSTVYNWIKRYKAGELEGLKDRPITGRPRKLGISDEMAVFRAITRKDPLHYNLEAALWTVDTVRDCIRQKFSIEVSKVLVGRLFKKLGLSAPAPLKRIYRLNPRRIERWQSEEFPTIVKLARQEKATVYFTYVTEVKSDWLRENESRPHQGLLMMSAITGKGSIRFLLLKGKKPTSDRFLKFLERLIHGANRPMWLIVDGHEYQRSHHVLNFVASTRGRLKLIFLPLYRPGYD
ncbi:IS630 family transposase [Geobacter sp. DSM 9736]|uniref:IS630 family transposase n=1 Tax=Geobacter sp. DSM 9736 TaxID=1277350 RepID=UPI000B4FE6D4|nr:IS630 family transposase [Geobacter sp. DSM 9736]SNB46514.1 Transposase [Geobacter sp. DSM 9736]